MDMQLAGQGGLRRLGIIAIIALGGVFIWRSLVDLPLGTLTDPGPAAAALLLASLVVICALWSMFSGASGLLAAEAEDEDLDDPKSLRHAALIAAVTLLAAAALGTLGYRLTILAILLFFLGPVERKPLVAVLAVSFVLSFGSFWLFDRVLKITLPTGPFGL
jgi:Tripartite tricarboxylate transporter TctB family